MARTPYEVRLDTLCLARDILAENACARRDNQMAMREFVGDGGTVVDLDDEDAPEPPELFNDHTFTADDVLVVAKKLNEFIAPGESF